MPKKEQTQEDLKNQDTSSDTGDGQPEDDKKSEESEEETITVPKAEYSKLVEDRDNYRTGLLNKKAEEREFKKSDEADGAEENLEDDKIKKIAQETTATAFAQIEQSNQKRAQKKFLQDPRHAEYIEDAPWDRLMSNFSSRRGKASSEDIIEDLQDAVLLEKRDSGKLDEYLAKGKEKLGAEIDMLGNAGGTGDSKENSKEAVAMTPEAEAMAKSMGNDPNKIKDIKEDDFVIDLTQKKSN